MIMDNAKLMETIEAGQLETARKELTRYGSIIETVDTEDNTGAHRIQTIGHWPNRYTLTMHNGRVMSIEVNGKIFTPAA